MSTLLRRQTIEAFSHTGHTAIVSQDVILSWSLWEQARLHVRKASIPTITEQWHHIAGLRTRARISVA